MTAPTVGVLALQGDFARHAGALARCGAAVREVRTPDELRGLGGLVLPGGESTTLLHLMAAGGFEPALRDFHARGGALFGTCAGLILLARQVTNPAQRSLALVDVAVERNSYGRQRESFDASAPATLDGHSLTIPMVFIRAPRIIRTGPGVEVLARHAGDVVLAREGRVLVATFHPELTGVTAVHAGFCRMLAPVRA